MDPKFIIEFDYMYKDIVLAHVKYDFVHGSVEFKNYTNCIALKPFGDSESANLEDVDTFYRFRCFDENRVDCDDLLESYGIKHFHAYEIVRLSHGIMISDDCWVRFVEDGDMTYEEAKNSIGILW